MRAPGQKKIAGTSDNQLDSWLSRCSVSTSIQANAMFQVNSERRNAVTVGPNRRNSGAATHASTASM